MYRGYRSNWRLIQLGISFMANSLLINQHIQSLVHGNVSLDLDEHVRKLGDSDLESSSVAFCSYFILAFFGIIIHAINWSLLRISLLSSEKSVSWPQEQQEEANSHSTHHGEKSCVDQKYCISTRAEGDSTTVPGAWDLFPSEAQERKVSFLKRAGSDYGYSLSPLGFIDKWRPHEIPGLINPLPSVDGGSMSDGRPFSKQETADKEVYMDYAGAALPHSKQLYEILRTNQQQILANPHSNGPAAARTSLAVEKVKKRLLDLWDGHPGKRFFGPSALSSNNVSPQAETPEADEGNSEIADDQDFHPGYEIIFTSGTTQALEMVAKSFPWRPRCPCGCSTQSTLVYPMNSHTSVIGIRGPAQGRGANFLCWPMSDIVGAIQSGRFTSKVLDADKRDTEPNQECHCRSQTDLGSTVPNLLVIPAECNFSGSRVDVEALLRRLRNGCDDNKGQYGSPITKSNKHCERKREQKWFSLIDLAKAACTSPINLRKMDADFACVSFYKMFGEPTGLGCLLVKRSILGMLIPPSSPPLKDGCIAHSSNMKTQLNHYSYFGGGSVNVVLPGRDFVVPRSSTEDSTAALSSLTHGTIHFRGIVALDAGLNVLDRMGGMETIQRHVDTLSKDLLSRLESLSHYNGEKAIEIYQWHDTVASGPTVAFNVRRGDGSYVGYNEVSKLAALNSPPIQLRTGCFCNPGGCQMALDISDDEVIYNYSKAGHVCGDDIDLVDGKPTGAVRVSLGKDSIWEEVDAVVTFLEKAFVSERIVGDSDREEALDGQARQVVISELYVYPIKSCRAQRVDKWKLERSSHRPLLDREFALVDSFGTAMRLAKYPKMAHISPKISLKTQTMTVSAPGKEPLTILLGQDSVCQSEGQGIIQVCGNKCGGVIWGDFKVSQWFSDFLGVRCWLARYSPNSSSYQCPEECPNVCRGGISPGERIPSTPSRQRKSVAFANEQPLLLISEHAVNILNNILVLQGQTQVTSRHFRPNIVVRLAGHNFCGNDRQRVHAEDGWTKIRGLGSKTDLRFEVVGQCARCSMVDVDPSSGAKGNALRALSGYRRNNGQITFGIFLKSLTSSTEHSIAGDIASLETDRESWLEVGDLLWCE